MTSSVATPPDLLPPEPLSQVVFIHDYIQLVFQSHGFSIYNLAQVTHGNSLLTQGSSGFCDAVAGLIGLHVIQVSSSPQHKLSLLFENQQQILVPSSQEYVRGPEAFQFTGPEHLLVVEQND